jgi:hypothetical protein
VESYLSIFSRTKISLTISKMGGWYVCREQVELPFQLDGRAYSYLVLVVAYPRLKTSSPVERCLVMICW